MKHLLKTTLLLLALLMPTLGTAHDFEVDGIYYKVNGNEATVTHKGSAYDEFSNEYSGDVIIPASVTFNGRTYPVTSIGYSTFYDCSNLTSIEIPKSVTLISSQAFYGCKGLTNIEIPNSVDSIGVRAFYRCTGLASVNIPNSVMAIGFDTFYGTAWYNNQPDGVVYAGLVAYKYKGIMPENTSINIKEGTLGVADGAFENCNNLTSIVIPNSITALGWSAFQFCSGLTCVVIPNSVTFIGGGAFAYCTGLESIVIPNSVAYLNNGTFAQCSGLTNIVIPNSVSSIAFSVFDGLTSLKDVYCFAATPPSSDSDYDSYSATLHVPAASLAAYFTAPIWCNFEIIVGDAVMPLEISISKDSVEVNLGVQFKLTATVTPSNASNKEIDWYSTDKDVATVDNGMVNAVGVGECDIYAYCFGMPAICHVSVVNRISLDQQEAIVLPNHILTLTPSASPVLPELAVTSSDPTVAAARVMNGKVQVVGVTEGTVTITVGSKDGTAIPATCLVTVYTELGDVNMDGFVNISDVTGLVNYLLNNDSTGLKIANADLDDNGRVSISDVTTLIKILLSSPSDN